MPSAWRHIPASRCWPRRSTRSMPGRTPMYREHSSPSASNILLNFIFTHVAWNGAIVGSGVFHERDGHSSILRAPLHPHAPPHRRSSKRGRWHATHGKTRGARERLLAAVCLAGATTSSWMGSTTSGVVEKCGSLSLTVDHRAGGGGVLRGVLSVLRTRRNAGSRRHCSRGKLRRRGKTCRTP